MSSKLAENPLNIFFQTTYFWNIEKGCFQVFILKVLIFNQLMDTPYFRAHYTEYNDNKMLSVSCVVHGSQGLTKGIYTCRSKKVLK